MGFIALARRGIVLAVALHLAALPVAASLHAATHYRFEAGVALNHDAASCPETAGPHRSHMEGARDSARDLLCEFCQLFHQGLRHQSGVDSPQADDPPRKRAPHAFTEDFLSSGGALALPRSRAPPHLV